MLGMELCGMTRDQIWRVLDSLRSKILSTVYMYVDLLSVYSAEE